MSYDIEAQAWRPGPLSLARRVTRRGRALLDTRRRYAIDWQWFRTPEVVNNAGQVFSSVFRGFRGKAKNVDNIIGSAIKGRSVLGKRPLVTDYYPVSKRYKTTLSYPKSMSDGDTQMADNAASTEANIGWGIHDAKTLYTRRKRFSKKALRKQYSRAKAKGSLSRYQKKYIRSKIKRRGIVTYPPCLTIIKKHSLYTHPADGGADFGINTLGCFHNPTANGFERITEKHVDIHALFKQLYTQADVTDATGLIWQPGSTEAGMKLHLKDMRGVFNFANNSTQTIHCKLWTFVCKKSITVDEMTGGSTTLPDVIGLLPTSLATYFTSTTYDEEDADAKKVPMNTGTADGYDPNYCYFAKKFLSVDKIQRWEMPSGSSVQFDVHHKIGMTVSYPTVLKYFAMKGISRFYYLQVQSAPYVDGSHVVQPSRGLAADTGIVMSLRKEYRWSPIWNSIDDLSVNQKHKYTPSASFESATQAQDNTEIEYHL